jgi:hypothetical protein
LDKVFEDSQETFSKKFLEPPEARLLPAKSQFIATTNENG